MKEEGRFKFYFLSYLEGNKSARPFYGGKQEGVETAFKKKKKKEEEEDSLLLDPVWRL